MHMYQRVTLHVLTCTFVYKMNPDQITFWLLSFTFQSFIFPLLSHIGLAPMTSHSKQDLDEKKFWMYFILLPVNNSSEKTSLSRYQRNG